MAANSAFRMAGVDVKQTFSNWVAAADCVALLDLISSQPKLDFCAADGFVSLFHIGREHIFDPFHERADSARQVAPMRDDEGHGERPATKIG
jgi:hypothetical protein